MRVHQTSTVAASLAGMAPRSRADQPNVGEDRGHRASLFFCCYNCCVCQRDLVPHPSAPRIKNLSGNKFFRMKKKSQDADLLQVSQRMSIASWKRGSSQLIGQSIPYIGSSTIFSS